MNGGGRTPPDRWASTTPDAFRIAYTAFADRRGATTQYRETFDDECGGSPTDDGKIAERTDGDGRTKRRRIRAAQSQLTPGTGGAVALVEVGHWCRSQTRRLYCDAQTVASEAICKWGGHNAGVPKFFDVPPHFSLVPPT